MGQMVVSIFSLIFCFFSSIFVTGLLSYHTFLIIKNRSTKEDLKNIFSSPFGNPFTRYILKLI
jgi:hypothetical protein